MPASRRRHQSSSASRRAPDSRRRCQTAKSGILDGQLRQRARLAGEKRQIERPDLAHQHAHRPAVAHDVMHHENEQVLVVRAAEHAAAQQRALFEVERQAALQRGHPPDLWIPPRGRQGAEVDHGQPRHEARRDHLHRLAVLGGGERGAQGLMAVGHAGERESQRRQVESPEDARRRRQVVDGSPGYRRSRNQSRSWLNERGSGASRSSRGSMRSVAPSAGLFLRRRSRRTACLAEEVRRACSAVEPSVVHLSSASSCRDGKRR